jgi:hypothetical protein
MTRAISRYSEVFLSRFSGKRGDYRNLRRKKNIIKIEGQYDAGKHPLLAALNSMN